MWTYRVALLLLVISVPLSAAEEKKRSLAEDIQAAEKKRKERIQDRIDERTLQKMEEARIRERHRKEHKRL